MSAWLSWLEHTPDKREVASSSPATDTNKKLSRRFIYMQYNQYNISNQIIRNYRKKFPYAHIYTRQYSTKFLLTYLNNHEEYPYIEYIDEFYEYHPNHSNWFDIEGMGYGWIWMSFPSGLWRRKIQESALSHIHSLKKSTKKLKIIVVEMNDMIIFHFPTRKIQEKSYPTHRDFIVCLSKKEFE